MNLRDLPARDRITRARAALVTNPAYAFFGTLALGLRLEESASLETMAVDGQRLFYNPAFVEGLRESELLAIVAHEVMHLASMHHVRRNGRDLETWNEACDYAINAGLAAAGLDLPAWVLRSAEFDGQGAEAIFAELMRRKPQGGAPESGGDDDQAPGPDASPSGAEGPQEGQDGPGQAPGDDAGQPGPEGSQAPDPGRMGGVIDAPAEAGTASEQAAEMESRVRQAISVARAANAGTLPGHLARLVDDLNAPRISWREALADFVDDAATRAASWAKPNKRFLGSGFYLPGTVADSVRSVAVVVDTSGSIDDGVLSAFRDEVQGMLDSGRVEAVHVVYCDSAVQGWQDFASGDVVALEPKGGGGTRFSPAFRHVADVASDAAAIVYLTDLECSDFGPEPEQPVLWAVWGRYRPRVPFGRVLPLDPFA